MNNHRVSLARVMRSLQAYGDYPSVSIVMPTHRTVPDKLQDHARLKKLISQAKSKLLEMSSAREVEPVVQKLESLLASYDFSASLDGVAVFASKNYGTVVPLPFVVQEQVMVGKGFWVKELLYSLHRSMNYFVLVLSTKLSRLFEGYNESLREIVTPLHDAQGVPLQGFPLDYVGPEQGNHDAIGRGDIDARYADEHLLRYFRLVDDELGKVLTEHSLPIIVCGSDEQISAFRKHTRHTHEILWYEKTDCSNASATQLAHLVWPKVAEHQKQEQEKMVKKFIEAEGASRQAFGIHRLWALASEGRIDTLLVEKGLLIPGKEDPENPSHVMVVDIIKAPDATDLVNALIERVLHIRGNVVFVEKDTLKNFEHLGAILRY
jgi:hypothetical protein